MSSDTEDRTLAAVLQLFEECGLHGATTRRIAEIAGVNEVTVFRHFGSKEALMLAAMLRASDQSGVPRLPAEPVDPRAELEGWVGARLALLTRKRRMIRKSFSEFENHPALSAQLREVPCRVASELGGYVRALRLHFILQAPRAPLGVGQRQPEGDGRLRVLQRRGPLGDQGLRRLAPRRAGRHALAPVVAHVGGSPEALTPAA